jgi:DNA-binding LacI/PurR family transcriptional regulator
MGSRVPTLNQVAALAGVSHQTVSRVLNHHANVSANPCPRPRRHPPLVAIGATTPSRAIGPPTVGIGNRAGAALATRHLLVLGHHTAHHLAGPPDCPEASERTTGWRR